MNLAPGSPTSAPQQAIMYLSKPFFASILVLSLQAWGIPYNTSAQSYIVKGSHSINLAHMAEPLRVFYSGCGGLYIEQGGTAILHDPFVSNLGPLVSVPFTKARSDTAVVDAYVRGLLGKEKDAAGTIKLLLVSHTHYDHFLDVPYLYHRKLNKDTVLMIGSESMKLGMELSENDYHTKVDTQRIIAENAHAATYEKMGVWRYASNRKVRVLPIISEHGPHYYGIKFFKGAWLPKWEALPQKSSKWLEGQTFSFLVDFLDAYGKPITRIFLQTSVSNAPLGLPPQEVLNEKAVDMAFLCVASYRYVKGYPQELLAALQPKHVTLVHWENFFQPYEKLKTKPTTVPFTNVRRFVKKFKEGIEGTNLEDNWLMPAPGTEIWVN